jgi:signal transduction histidine kinase
VSLAGRTVHTVRAVGRFGRIGLALGLLAALWFGTVTGVDRGSREADDRRASDREAVAAGFASSVGEWLDAGRTEVMTLSRTIGVAPGSAAQGAIGSFFGQPQIFSRSAVVFGGSRIVTAASPRRAVLIGLAPNPCSRNGENGDVVVDTDLEEIVTAARASTTPVVSRFFDVPGDCKTGVAIAASSGSAVTVVFGDVADVTARVAAGSMIADPIATTTKPAGTRLLVVTGDVALDPQVGLVTTPPRLATLAGAAAKGHEPEHTRYTIGETGDAEVVAALAPVGDGWSVALEQDAAVFDIELQNRPSVLVASVLTVVFAVVFALLAIFDSRRRRAHRKTDQAKNAFFSIAGHELRTPLTSLKGFAEMLSTNWNDLDNAKRRQLVERMAPQTRRLDRLVERLLVAASIQAETHTRPQVRDIDPVPALEQVAEGFAAEAPLHTFDVDVARNVGQIQADPRALDQVLQHLVENAVKYSPSGGRVWLSAARKKGFVELSVEDEGVGLPSDRHAIFDKFVQGESVTKRVHDEGGVGLGLYIVRTLVEDMGGSVRAEPAATGGARFVVALRPAKTLSPNRQRKVKASVRSTEDAVATTD